MRMPRSPILNSTTSGVSAEKLRVTWSLKAAALLNELRKVRENELLTGSSTSIRTCWDLSSDVFSLSSVLPSAISPLMERIRDLVVVSILTKIVSFYLKARVN